MSSALASARTFARKRRCAYVAGSWTWTACISLSVSHGLAQDVISRASVASCGTLASTWLRGFGSLTVPTIESRRMYQPTVSAPFAW